MSVGRFDNWHQECEEYVNRQIALEYTASLQYHALSGYFDHDTVGLKNIAKFFNHCSLEEREHADSLVAYQNKRGGRAIISPVNEINNNFYNPAIEESDLLQAFRYALDMEQKVYKSLLTLHSLGEKTGDPALTDFIEGEYLKEQIDAINELSVYVSQLARIGRDGHGLWDFDHRFKLPESS
tara:strand:+ start:211 stop:756 length:546 start_codon:yes stop_codon:yes gene_type:complete